MNLKSECDLIQLHKEKLVNNKMNSHFTFTLVIWCSSVNQICQTLFNLRNFGFELNISNPRF